MLDANLDDAFCDSHGVLWNELFKRDEKTGLDGYSSVDAGSPTLNQLPRTRRMVEGSTYVRNGLPVTE